jgi:Transglycosylase SLT domain
MAGFKIADAYVEVDIDQATLDAAILETTAKLAAIKDKAIDIGLNVADVDADIVKIKAMLLELHDRNLDVNVELNQADLLFAIAEINAAMIALQDKFNIHIDTSGIAASFAEVTAGAMAARESMTLATASTSSAMQGIHIWGTGVTLTFTQLHWIMGVTSEALAVIGPALVAAGAGAMVMVEGAGWILDRLQSTFNTTEATASLYHKTMGQSLGIPGGSLQVAQTAMDPQVYELLGAAINGATESFHGLWAEGEQVVGVLDKFAAEVDVGMKSASGEISQLTGKGTQDLAELGEVLGNLALTFFHLAANMPGLSDVLLKVLDGITRLFSVITSAPGILITLALGLEESWRWGGLFAGILGGLITKIGALIFTVGGGIKSVGLLGTAGAAAGTAVEDAGAGMVGVGEFLSGPWGWAIMGAVAGLAVLGFWLSNVKDSAQQMASSMNAAISGANFATGLGDAVMDLSKLQTAIVQTETKITSLGGAMAGSSMTGLSYHGENPQIASAHQDIADLQTYQQEYTKLISSIVDTLAISTKFGGQTYSLAQTMGLATAAGLNLNTAFGANGKLTAVAAQEISNLVVGYKAMDQSGGQLYTDIQAINVETLLQQTRVTQLNQAWDQYLQQLTGGTGGLATLISDLQQMGNVSLPDATKKFSEFSQASASDGGGVDLSVKQISESLTTMDTVGAQAWKNYNSSITDARNLMDWFNTAAAEGVLNQSQFTAAMKATVAELIPYAANSKTAQAELLGLAAQGDGGITTFKGLTSWVGNTKNATKNLNDIVGIATQGMSNLNAVAANLSSTLDAVVDQAIANGAINIKGITSATQGFTQSLLENGAQSDVTKQKLQDLAGQLHTSGVSATSAKDIIYQLAIQEGDTKTQAQSLSAEIGTMITKLNQIPKTEATNIAVTGRGSWSVQELISNGQGIPGVSTPGAPGVTLPGHATGGVIPGYAPGKDSVLTLLSPGEGILVPEVVRRLGPGRIDEWNRIGTAGRRTEVGRGGSGQEGMRWLMAGNAGALHAHGMAGGGVVGSFSGSAPGLGSWADSEAGSTLNAIDSSVAAATTSAITNLMSSGGPGGHISGNAMGWIVAALAMAHAPASWANILSVLVGKESGGNPNAVDPISVGGQHAEGLWQMLPSTFGMYSAGGSLWNPIMEGVAAIRYIQSRYGSPYGIPGLSGGNYVGYKSGGTIPLGQTGIVGEGGQSEYVTATALGAQVTPMRGTSGSGVTVIQNFYGTQMPTTEQKAQMKLEASLALNTAP